MSSTKLRTASDRNVGSINIALMLKKIKPVFFLVSTIIPNNPNKNQERSFLETFKKKVSLFSSHIGSAGD